MVRHRSALRAGLAAGTLACLAFAAGAAAMPKVAWESDRDGDREIYVADPDGSGTPLNISNDPAEADTAAALSADGTKVAWEKDRPFPEGADVYIAPTDGSATPFNVTDGVANDIQPSTSADGEWVAWRSDRDGDTEIYVGRTDGTGTPVNVSQDVASDTEPTLSADGSMVAWRSDRDGNSEVYVAKADGSDVPRNLSNDAGGDQDPHLSGDGSRLVWESSRTGEREIFSAPTDGSGIPINLSNDPANQDEDPSIAANGSLAAWESDRGGAASSIWVASADGSGSPSNASRNAGDDEEAALPANGERVAFRSLRDGDNEVYVDSTLGPSNPINVSKSPASVDTFPSFADDTVIVPPATPVPPPAAPMVPAAPAGPAGPPGPAVCAEVTERGTPNEVRVPERITASYLRTNQATGSATVRRANAIEAWLNAGIEDRDHCGGSIGQEDLEPSLSWALGPLRPSSPPDPRPVEIPDAATKRVVFEENALQMCTNQRIYQVGIARINALTARVEGMLTGGDVIDGALGQPRLRQDLYITAAASPISPAAASTTDVEQPERSGCGGVSFTPQQAAINRRIAIASVVRSNELLDQLARGLTGANYVDGTLTVADFA